MRLRILFLFFGLFACTTRSTVSYEYAEALGVKLKTQKSKMTTVLFLVDGLSKDILIQQIKAGHLPEIRKHFLISDTSKNIHQAYTAFPSLTFTNIANIISEKPIHLSRATGNKIFQHEDDFLNFESVFDRSQFSKSLSGQSIFYRLNLKNQTSISLDYGLGSDATAYSTNKDIEVGIALGFKNYFFLDQKKIISMNKILDEYKTTDWPNFIFIHLVGIDLISHKLGKHSPEVSKYLRLLDRQLAGVFKSLRKAESSEHQTISILTADHGFSKVPKTFPYRTRSFLNGRQR